MCLKDALKKLTPMISENKRAKVASVVSSRSNSLSILLENIQNKGNENAILRSMDAFGCLNLHKLTTASHHAHSYKNDKPRQQDAGASSWVRINHWFNARECIHHLKNRGYTLAVTCPTAKTSIMDVDFSQKLIVGFGNEIDGITKELAELSDISFSLPMCGFVPSYNISVSVAITLYHAYLQRILIHVSNTMLIYK